MPIKDYSLKDHYNYLYQSEKTSLKKLEFKWPRNRYEAEIKWAGSGKKMLEIGCGSGLVLYNLNDRFQELYGLELSKIRAERAQKFFDERKMHKINIMEGNIERRLNFPDNYFDCIIWADVVEHITNIFGAMEQIKRLLSRGGTLLTTTPNIAELRRRLLLLFGSFPATSGKNEGLMVRDNELFDGGHLHYFTFSSIEKLYTKYEIKPEKRYGFGKFGFFHNLYPSLLSSAVCIKGIKR